MLVNFQSIVKCCREKKRILVWRDHSTTWIEMEATADQTAQTFASLYAVCICYSYGASSVWLTMGQRTFWVPWSSRSTEHCKTSAYQPQCCGEVEVKPVQVYHSRFVVYLSMDTRCGFSVIAMWLMIVIANKFTNFRKVSKIPWLLRIDE